MRRFAMGDMSYKDFASDLEVRWCPGCGDYSILKSVLQALADSGSKPEKTVFVSGIGCASRMPYYIDTYGFHTIHGRAPAVATGIKLANPELEVWIVTGDGDGLSIGGNHLLHLCRRNLDVTLLLLNNEIYGLTKGQFSPTSRLGTFSPSTPKGSLTEPIAPCRFALGSDATFIARAIDVDQKRLPGILVQAKAHKGTSFVEVLQNCIVYNKDVFEEVAGKSGAADHQIHVRHGEPLVFGMSNEKGLRLDRQALSIEIIDAKAQPEEVLIHDETNRLLASLLIDLKPPLPTAFGVIHRRAAPSIEEVIHRQRQAKPPISIDSLLRRAVIHDHR